MRGKSNGKCEFIAKEFKKLGHKIDELNSMIGSVDKEIQKIKSREQSRAGLHSELSMDSLVNNSKRTFISNHNKFVFVDPRTNTEIPSELDLRSKLDQKHRRDDSYSFSNPSKNQNKYDDSVNWLKNHYNPITVFSCNRRYNNNNKR